MQVKNGRFYADWRDHEGRRQRKAFDTSRDARKHQAQMQAESRLLKAQHAKTVGNLAHAWFAGRTFGTKQERWSCRYVMEDLCQVAGNLQAKDLTYLVTNALVEKWRAAGYARSSLQNFRYYLRSLCEWLEMHGAVGLVKRLTKTLAPQARQVTAEPWEIEKLKELGEPWFKCFLVLCLDGGLRRNEAMKVCPANYAPDQNKITLTVKKKRVHSFTITEELKSLFALAPLAENPNTPFVDLLNGHKVSKYWLEKTWARLRERGKINPALTPHDLRRTMATAIYREHKDLRLVQAYLAHANPITTLHYIKFVDPLLIQPLLEDLKVTVFRSVRRKEIGL